MAGKYLAHYGVKGQKKGIRNYQSYESKPTRSGMVGEERGDAARDPHRERSLRDTLNSGYDGNRYLKKVNDMAYKRFGKKADKYSKKYNKALTSGKMDKARSMESKANRYSELYKLGRNNLSSISGLKDVKLRNKMYNENARSYGKKIDKYTRKGNTAKAEHYRKMYEGTKRSIGRMNAQQLGKERQRRNVSAGIGLLTGGVPGALAVNKITKRMRQRKRGMRNYS